MTDHQDMGTEVGEPPTSSGYFPHPDGIRPVVTTIRHRPVELSVVLVSAVLGLSSMTGIGATPTANSIAALNEPLRLLWVGLFVAAALVVLVAALFRDPIRSLLIERIGLLPLGLFLGSYAVVSLLTGPPDRFTIGPVIWGVLGAGVITRAVLIGRDLSRLQRTLRAVAAVREAEVRRDGS